MTTQELATRNGSAVQYRASSIGTERLGEILVRSGFFKDARDQSQAIVKVLAGQELGLGPIASMQGIYIVEGKISLSAGLIAAAIQRSGKYRYRVLRWNDSECEIAFFEGQEKLGPSLFTMADAQRAGLAGKGPWKSYPKAMLWARAMSAGARAYTPEIFSGAIYTPEELGSEVDEEGVPLMIEAQPVNVQAPQVTHVEPEHATPASRPLPTQKTCRRCGEDFEAVRHDEPDGQHVYPLVDWAKYLREHGEHKLFFCGACFDQERAETDL